MKVEFLSSFSKDLDRIVDKQLKSKLIQVIETLENCESLTQIANVKKLKGSAIAYRIRIGNYRLGFYSENNTIEIARFVHRKEIYRTFP